jgi:hypothetical protein
MDLQLDQKLADALFKDVGKTTIIDRHAYRMISMAERIKELPQEQIQAFLVSLVKKAQDEECFKSYPFPNRKAQEFIYTHFERGKP